ncbi:hypothetical protein [Candidiatus Paracoxiella cheracis]|uniref:hypothetical protein n=1 Tax=Candidiatus Paracoxiella cheracis TaxID=3405120 RepID=UPI003BF46243
MPRQKNSSNDVRDLQKQVTKLQQELSALEAQRLADIEAAAEAGYELGFIEAEEKELRRAQAIADAIVAFEKSYESKAKSNKASVAKKAAKAPKASKGRPAKRKKRAKKAEASTAPAAELPSVHVPETGEVAIN